jgi:anaphase-promoting complex subunit 8
MEDYFQYSKSLFDQKEYQRCHFYMEKIEIQKPTKQSNKCVFLKLYSLYLAGEKRRKEELNQSIEHVEEENKELKKIYQELNKHSFQDPFLKYLFGVVLKSMKREQEARKYFIESVNEYPLLWSSWLEIIQLCETKEDVKKI